MAHRVGVIAWGALDSAIQFQTANNDLRITYDRKKGHNDECNR